MEEWESLSLEDARIAVRLTRVSRFESMLSVLGRLPCSFFHFSLNSLHFTSHRLNSILDNALSSRSSYNYTNRPHPTRTPLRLWHLIRTMYTCYIPQLQTGSWVTYIRTSLELDVQHVLCRVVVQPYKFYLDI